jgi:hypothetical protein
MMFASMETLLFIAAAKKAGLMLKVRLKQFAA